jgi:hypothetical protein
MGEYYHVNPNLGKSDNSGKIDSPVDSLATAYNLCGDGTGDGVVVWSYGSTTAATSSYLTASLTWAKNGITVYGVCAPTMIGQRSRITNKSTSTNLPSLMNVTGINNSFYNLNVGNFGTDAAALGGVIVTGYRNYFENCQIVGAGSATPAQTQGANSLSLVGSQETTFRKCVIGTDTVDQAGGATINGVINFQSGVERVTFDQCTVLSYYSTSAATSGAILHVGAGDSITRPVYFNNCLFVNYKAGALDSSPPAYLVVGTAPNNGVVVLNCCGYVGFNAPDTTNNRVYVIGAVATGLTSGKGVKAA